jgi:hypothetical protein
MDANIQDFLAARHQDAIGWLKYAESKNAALAAIAAGALYASTNLAANHSSGFVTTAGGFAAAFFLLALAMAIVSFLPITNAGFVSAFERKSADDAPLNLVYFADLAELQPEDLVRRLADQLSLPASKTGRELCVDMAAQAIVNSRIARRKLAFFECGTWLFVSGLLTPVAAFLLFWSTGGPTRFARRG